ncbi:secA regulator SecM [Photorhabdus laumondii subsp. laumondii]|uniref:Secretion monitor n=2 Tax=Photorhabdus laumondii subsp. laumondii TaxID=141679 RepID=SECM_PHOLL|nr:MULTISPECIES: secA translation cis-regulator SecM [Photorhabdus]Q7N155.1 RecName: Full=Secretion monitor; Flags: Precursor [Photorhabdus laumondii subsp. laumondii TTO1]AWK43271.1 SecA regulator SecM [Photorhabdus laumondii subsp. laumondii]AXG43932.1 SecA regulator SecM [Photorhabdus laumondii subsp. laumondii]AXG48589.1 SecA regulator SecM [Photorhabdus laumondii subsp. laumondii]MCC8382295.1 secA regulator SecM [Photorhabdus laumondii]MCC8387230.1 secA regulator SecM [Photorhabdus laumo
MGILNLWRQFGRRYFWSHLLLGVVAASIGAPTILAGVTDNISQANTSPSQSWQNQALSAFDNLFSLQNVQHQPANGVNYWQQHAVRNVIRQLSFAFSISQPMSDETAKQSIRLSSSNIQQLVLETLNTLLIREPKPPEPVLDIPFLNVASQSSYILTLWIAKAQGIRAGPTAYL